MTADAAALAGAARAALRRAFTLPEAETEFLNATHPDWETLIDGATPWLILANFPIPSGYSHQRVQAAIQISSGFPNSALDMVYFLPGLTRADARPITGLASQLINGQTWQRWSRHYGWRPGVDDLVTHIERIKSWLVDELTR